MKPLHLLIALALGFALGALAFSLFSQQEINCPACLNGRIETVFSPDSESEIISIIRSANKSIDVEMYLFSYGGLVDELIDAKTRGVAVRVILEPRLSGDNANLATMERLRDGGIPAKWATLDYKLTHTKAVIIDGKKVLVGSTNWSTSALTRNREYSVLIEDENVAREFLLNFE
ncbi:MAG: phospholipase D-like domain-containing protein, partial [Candidatus Micrarchaeota archaeon]